MEAEVFEVKDGVFFFSKVTRKNMIERWSFSPPFLFPSSPEASVRASSTRCTISISISGGMSSSVVTGGASRAGGAIASVSAANDGSKKKRVSSLTIDALLLSEGGVSLRLLFFVERSMSSGDRGGREGSEWSVNRERGGRAKCEDFFSSGATPTNF